MSEAVSSETSAPVVPNGMPVHITEKAIEMVKKAIADEGLENHGLRVAVHGGGCSGLQYALDFSDKKRPGDTTFVVGDLEVFIDMASLQYLSGAEIDYVTGLQGSGFKFSNPNATRTCGCGHSFS